MKILNKKPLILGLWAIFCLSFLFIYSLPVKAVSSSVRQVRTSNNPAVYYLYHGGHRKKVYLSANIYLDYGNKWSDVKMISSSELNSWPDVKLIKKTGSPAVFYISGNKKSLISSWRDLEDFSLDTEPIINVSQLELNSYQEIGNEEIGLKNGSSLVLPNENQAATTTPIIAPAELGDLFVYNDLVKGANANTIVSGSNNNLMGIFRFSSSQKVATITSLTFDFIGIYDEAALNSASVLDANNAKYPNSDVSLSQSRHQATINFHDPIIINPGSEKTVKIYLDVSSGSFNNQAIHVEMKQAANIKSNLSPNASFPLKGTEFKILSGANVLGMVKSQEKSISASAGSSAGSRLIGDFVISEESSKEDIEVKNLTFLNSGSANVNDWDSFRLFNNGQIISRASVVTVDNLISFDVTYLHIIKGKSADLTVLASLKTNHNKNATVNLQLYSALVIGKTYNNYLTTDIQNINESATLN